MHINEHQKTPRGLSQGRGGDRTPPPAGGGAAAEAGIPGAENRTDNTNQTTTPMTTKSNTHMDITNTCYQPWDSIDRSILATVATDIAKLPERRLRAEIRKLLPPAYDEDGDPVKTRIKRLETTDLMGVPGAAVLATLEMDLVGAQGYSQAGCAIVAEIMGKQIPVIIIRPRGADESTLRHEKIHLCQRLNPGRWPDAADMAELVGGSFRALADASTGLLKAAADICHELLMELEAYRFSRDEAGDTSVCDKILRGSGASARPFFWVEALCETGDVDYDSMISDFLQGLIKAFCDHVEATVPWVGQLVRNSSYSGWNDALCSQHMDAIEAIMSP